MSQRDLVESCPSVVDVEVLDEDRGILLRVIATLLVPETGTHTLA
jgi:hypothetical protein